MKNSSFNLEESNFLQICEEFCFFQFLDKKDYFPYSDPTSPLVLLKCIGLSQTSHCPLSEISKGSPTNSLSKAKLLSSTFSGLSPPRDGTRFWTTIDGGRGWRVGVWTCRFQHKQKLYKETQSMFDDVCILGKKYGFISIIKHHYHPTIEQKCFQDSGVL